MGNNSGDMKRNHKKANRTMITKDKSITSLKKIDLSVFVYMCATTDDKTRAMVFNCFCDNLRPKGILNQYR